MRRVVAVRMNAKQQSDNRPYIDAEIIMHNPEHKRCRQRSPRARFDVSSIFRGLSYEFFSAVSSSFIY